MGKIVAAVLTDSPPPGIIPQLFFINENCFLFIDDLAKYYSDYFSCSKFQEQMVNFKEFYLDVVFLPADT